MNADCSTLKSRTLTTRKVDGMNVLALSENRIDAFAGKGLFLDVEVKEFTGFTIAARRRRRGRDRRRRSLGLLCQRCGLRKRQGQVVRRIARLLDAEQLDRCEQVQLQIALDYLALVEHAWARFGEDKLAQVAAGRAFIHAEQALLRAVSGCDAECRRFGPGQVLGQFQTIAKDVRGQFSARRATGDSLVKAARERVLCVVEFAILVRQARSAALLAIGKEPLLAVGDSLGGARTRPSRRIHPASLTEQESHNATVGGISCVAQRFVLVALEFKELGLRKNQDGIEFATTLVIRLAQRIGAAAEKFSLRELQLGPAELVHVIAEKLPLLAGIVFQPGRHLSGAGRDGHEHGLERLPSPLVAAEWLVEQRVPETRIAREHAVNSGGPAPAQRFVVIVVS